MIKTSLLVVLLLLGSVVTQDYILTSAELDNAALMTQLNNYFGCKVWSEDSCLQCSDRFFFNKNGVCCEVQGTCQQFNSKEGVCERCYEGYIVQNGKCVKQDNATPDHLGCALWNKGVCSQCSKRWYFNAQNVCTPISDLCSSWKDNGECSSCYYGYLVQNGACVVDNDLSIVPNSNLLCRIWKGKVCAECSDRTFFNKNGVCTSVSSQCNSFDKSTGDCLTCFKGYDIKNGDCVASNSNTVHPSDLGCSIWDWDNQVCLTCANRWAFNTNKVCVPVSDQCATADKNGNCLTCYQGYDLKDGQCLYSANNVAKPKDNGCGTWDWNNQICLKCSNGWSLGNDKICTPVSDLCKTHDTAGNCLTCFNGYDLKDGKCIFSDSNKAHPADLGCATWDWNNQICLKCSNGWVNNQNNRCVPVSDQCKSHDDKGNCLTCYQGYDLKQGQCIFSNSNNAKPADSGCATWDWNNQLCLKCSNGWAFNDKKVCIAISDLCKSHDEKGNCLTCYQGYDLVKGSCLYSNLNSIKPADLGCSEWDWNNQVCIRCSNNWTFNSKKVCVPVSDQCKGHDQKGDCLACYQGYDLKQGQCLFSQLNSAKPSDSGCGLWDWNNQICLKCSNRWTFNDKKNCVPISDQCKTNDDKGNCLTCYQGYDLKQGQCLFSELNSAKPADSGCGLWDWNNQACLKCSKGYTFNQKNICTPVSDQCKSNDDKGNCLSCYQGYDLINGQCLFSKSNNAHPTDLGCGLWDWNNQVCLKCSNGWTFNDKKACVPVSDQCKTHDDKGNCLTCYQGYDLNQGQCLFSSSNSAKPSDLGCATWDWNNQLCLKCSNGWTFNDKKICVAVSDQCKTHDDKGNCLTCYQGYDLLNGQCLFSNSNNAHPSDLGCGTWDWNNQVCLKCSQHWFFNIHKKCVPADDNCKSFDEIGLCTSCYSGYGLNSGLCVSVNPLCKSINKDGTCASCYPQNVLHGGSCVPIAKLANILLYYAECCPQKLAALKNNN